MLGIGGGGEGGEEKVEKEVKENPWAAAAAQGGRQYNVEFIHTSPLRAYKPWVSFNAW